MLETFRKAHSVAAVAFAAHATVYSLPRGAMTSSVASDDMSRLMRYGTM
jgi:hypothetical protein